MAECSSKVTLLSKADEEKTSLSSKHFPQYGTSSCCTKSKPVEENSEFYIKHLVEENESLNSIALKYGLTTSTLRRVNRLWNDNIFLCKQLLIPICNRDDLPASFNGELIAKKDLNKHMPKSKSIGRLADSTNNSNYFSNPNTPIASNCLNAKDSEDSHNITNHQDYFSKYDSSLAKIKCNIERLEKQTK
ncbi:hypothetical protein HELRODRAFT_159507 [Helobdella robusta]|uniref:LysM domain-containing protein n=1 Tax=Helobdella robusta TaxID=6412 RepID=T1EP41_HELRO|nr:hypothetical protein HELRODRAFT_159507 [Helobdella robusta]ESO12919.1 hypothetical protein HELRODRAFT_159507 [Helobdella robusta]